MNRFVIPSLLAVTLAGVWGFGWRARSAPRASSDVPVLRVTDAVDMGEVEAGQVATAQLDIFNDGAADLAIAGVRSSCGCTGLERQTADGSFSKVEELTVPPHGQATVFVRMAVNGAAGDTLGSVVTFVTNDPAAPEVTLPVRLRRILAGARATPEVVAFGTVPVGRPVAQLIDIVDRSPTPRGVSRIESTHPADFTATVVPVPDAEATVPGGRIIARLRVDVRTAATKDVDGRVNLWLATDSPASPVSVRVTGRVAAPVELSPNTLVLPLESDAGPVYRGAVLCRAFDPVTAVRVVSAPGGFTITVSDPVAAAAPRRITIERTPAAPAAGTVRVLLAVTVGGTETVHPITVICNP